MEHKWYIVHAYSNFENKVADAIKQCAYRYQETLLRGSEDAEAHIIKVLGFDDGGRVIQVLKNEAFDENMFVELTASSASVASSHSATTVGYIDWMAVAVSADSASITRTPRGRAFVVLRG